MMERPDQENIGPDPLKSFRVYTKGTNSKNTTNSVYKLANDGGQKQLRELTAEQKDQIKRIIKKAYRIELADDFCLLFGSFMASAGISPVSALDIIGTTIEELGDDLDLEKRLKCVLLGYKKSGIDLSQYKERIEEFPISSDDLEIEASFHNFSSFEELLSSILGGKKAIKTITDIQKALGIGLLIPPMKTTEREELYYAIAQDIMRRNVIKTFYTRSGDKESIIGIFRYNGLTYEPYEAGLEAEIERLTKLRADLSKKGTRWVRNEAFAKIRALTLTELREEPLMIAFQNAIFDWKRFLEGKSIRESIERPNPDLVVFHKIPHNLITDTEYDGNLEGLAEKLCPNTLRTFKEWVDDFWINLFEIIGYCLYPKYDLNKAFLLVGEGSNGKSTYLRFLEDILGSENVKHIPLQSLCGPNNRFSASELYHKLANICNELPVLPIKYTYDFKKLTGEDSITADRKFKSSIDFRSYAKQIFAGNELPPVSDMTYAFWRRWIAIEFPHQFEVNAGFYEERFNEKEKEGAIVVGLYAIREVLKRGKFSFEESAASYQKMWLRASNSVYAFLDDLFSGQIYGYRAERDPNARIEASELYQIYVDYCGNTDRDKLTQKAFTEEMKRQGFERVMIRGRSHYRGIKLMRIEEKDQGEETLIS